MAHYADTSLMKKFKNVFKRKGIIQLFDMLLIAQTVAGVTFLVSDPTDNLSSIERILLLVFVIAMLSQVYVRNRFKKSLEKVKNVVFDQDRILRESAIAGHTKVVAQSIVDKMQSPVLALEGVIKRFEFYMNSDSFNADELQRNVDRLKRASQNFKQLSKSLEIQGSQSTQDLRVPYHEVFQSLETLIGAKTRRNLIELRMPHTTVLNTQEYCGEVQSLVNLLLGLLDESIKALMASSEKWIHVEFFEKEKHFEVHVSDSGASLYELERECSSHSFKKGNRLSERLKLMASSFGIDLKLLQDTKNNHWVLTMNKAEQILKNELDQSQLAHIQN